MAPKPKMTVNNWDAELAKYAGAASAVENQIATGGNFLSLKSGRLGYKGSEIPGNKLSAVVLDQILEHYYYEGEYDPNTPSSPVCFAYGEIADDGTMEEMRPHPKSVKPQCESCDKCPLNQFGSAERGKGKACKNVRRLALISETDLGDVTGAEVALLKVPVMSVKGWSGYVKQVADVLKRPPFAVVTTVSVVPDPKSQFRVQFELKAPIQDGQTIGAIIAKRESAHQELVVPYTPSPEAEAPATKPAGKRKF